MTFMDKAYTLRTEVHSGGETLYFISFTDGQGEFYDLEVSEAFYMEFRQMERKNRNLQQSDWRHYEASELWDETLYDRAFRVPKSVEELVSDAEQREFLYRAISKLPETQRRRFLLYYEYDFNFREIGEMEHCRPQSIRNSVLRAREKLQAEIEKCRAG
ncbi:MAG: sigma-70 family RNA polymerase sigma factor [Subdoligranulum sp.]|nr:sigma-70 family RNA polymerase sigma factor [Subdoligranulum sp.]